LWLDAGTARAHGDPKRVIDAYLMDVAAAEDAGLSHPKTHIPKPKSQEEGSGEPEDLFKASEGRWGSREVEITAVEFLARDGRPAHVFQSGDPVQIRMRVRAAAPVKDFAFGIAIFTVEGVCCYGTNTHIEGAAPEELSGEGEITLSIDRLDLVAGSYKVDVAVHRQNGAPYDYHRLLYTLRVSSSLKDTGIFRPPHRWTCSGGIRIGGLHS